MADTDQPRSGLVVVPSDVPPPLPARSPLRQRPALQVDAMPGISSLNTILDALDAIAADTNKNKPMPPLPADTPASKDTDHNTDKASPSPTGSEPQMSNASPPLTKRQHALHELLSSERAYASDLALIKEVHIPLALDQTEGVPNLPITPPSSSGPSSRTVSTVSDTPSSPSPPPGPPMTPDDVKIIFGNIAEIALFSDLFCQELEEALGALLEGGQGEDSVGALFLRIIPELERPYKQYITRHPTALTHLQQLPQTPALQHYLTYTRNIASSLSHAWDLSSLLIKPVQRLLKYPLLLTAIIDETPDSHPDKGNLREAHKKMEEVARNVNEGRRRAEVIRDVLASKKKSVGVTVSASVNLTKMKSLRVSGGKGASMAKDKDGDKPSEEAALVDKLEKELKAIEEFAQKFAKNVVDWARMARNVVATLRTWAINFGKVIGLTDEQGSEAFDQFMVVIEQQLTPLCADLEATINERVLKELAHLLMTMNQPLKLLDSMNEQEPYHHHLLNMIVSAKNRPPPSLLAASTNYLALRGQLAAELPTYVSLLHRGLLMFVMRTAEIQQDFYGTMRKYWEDLWEMLRVEGEMNAGHEETMNVWRGRWSEVDKFLSTCAIIQDPKIWREIEKNRLKERERERQREREKEVQYAYNAHVHEPYQRDRYSSSSSSSAPHRNTPAVNSSPEQPYLRHKQSQAAKVGSMLNALAPTPSVSSTMSATTIAAVSLYSSTSIVGPYVAPPISLPSRSHEKDFDGRRGLGRKTSMDSLRSSGTAKSPTSRGRYRGEYHDQQENQEYSGSREYPKYYDHGSNGHSFHPGMPRRRTTGPARPEDMVEYDISRQELELEREKNGRRAGYGRSAHAREREEYDHEHPRSREYVRPVVVGPGLPRTMSMPAPYHHQIPASEWRGRDTGTGESGATGSGEWDYVDEDDVQYYANEHGFDDHNLDGNERRMNEGRSRGRKGGEAEEESKRYSEYSQCSQKSREKSRTKEREKSRDKSREKRPREKAKDKETERKEKEKDSSDKKDKESRPSSSRKHSGSIKQFFTSNRDSHHSDSKERRKSRDKEKDSDADQNPFRSHSSPRDSWALKPAKYVCQVIYPCQPPPASSSPGAPPIPITYYAFPFFTLKEGELYEVLQEAGHPSLHPRLPLVVDEGEDCLLLCRNCEGNVGWALASFLEPVEIDR